MIYYDNLWKVLWVPSLEVVWETPLEGLWGLGHKMSYTSKCVMHREKYHVQDITFWVKVHLVSIF